MRLILSALVYAACAYTANALPFPIPQPKGCPIFWDSAKALNVAKHHPLSTGRYLSDPHFVLFLSKQGVGVMYSHTKRGCLVIRQIPPHEAQKLLTDQEDA